NGVPEFMPAIQTSIVWRRTSSGNPSSATRAATSASLVQVTVLFGMWMFLARGRKTGSARANGSLAIHILYRSHLTAACMARSSPLVNTSESRWILENAWPARREARHRPRRDEQAAATQRERLVIGEHGAVLHQIPSHCDFTVRRCDRGDGGSSS